MQQTLIRAAGVINFAFKQLHSVCDTAKSLQIKQNVTNFFPGILRYGEARASLHLHLVYANTSVLSCSQQFRGEG